MPNTYQLGACRARLRAKQSAFGTAPTFAATDAIRHLMVKLNYSPRNRVDSEDRWTHPSLRSAQDAPHDGDWALGGIFWPSGTLNTLPDHTDILECGLGA
jgi:hypothetical protein